VDAVGFKLAVFIPDRDIFSGLENVITEPISRLVFGACRTRIIERPSTTFAAGAMDEKSTLLNIAVANSMNKAQVPLPLPPLEAYATMLIEWGDKVIAVALGTLRVILSASERHLNAA
jgi:hypothetical protein